MSNIVARQKHRIAELEHLVVKLTESSAMADDEIRKRSIIQKGLEGQIATLSAENTELKAKLKEHEPETLEVMPKGDIP